MNDSREDCYYCGAMLNAFEQLLCSFCEGFWARGTSSTKQHRGHMQCVEDLIEKAKVPSADIAPQESQRKEASPRI